MVVDVVTEARILAPIARVSEYASNPDNAPVWYANIDSVEWLSTPPPSVGSRLAFVAHFLGRRMTYTYEIIEFAPQQRLVMSTGEGPFPMETTYEWRPDGAAATCMRLRNRGQPSGFSKVAAPLMVRAMRRANEKDLALLKKLLESS